VNQEGCYQKTCSQDVSPRTMNLLNAVSFFLPPPPPAEDFARRQRKMGLYITRRNDSGDMLFFAGFSTSTLEEVRVAIVQEAATG
jgi:hypothetical protein